MLLLLCGIALAISGAVLAVLPRLSRTRRSWMVPVGGVLLIAGLGCFASEFAAASL